MLIVKRKEGEKIERLLSRYKKKFKKTKVLQGLKSKKNYKKRSEARREEVNRAKYIQSQKKS
tara:strand:- start:37 stop:222 length:186 start_codon:yes stop_codon:yes gene_type:complete